jgi:hypothetical protein
MHPFCDLTWQTTNTLFATKSFLNLGCSIEWCVVGLELYLEKNWSLSANLFKQRLALISVDMYCICSSIPQTFI